MTQYSTEGAAQILRQLGGREFIAMTGVNSMSGCDGILNMRLRRNKSGATGLRITLDEATDTYTMDFIRLRNFEMISVAKLRDVHAEQLRENFELITGYDTRIPRVIGINA